MYKARERVEWDHTSNLMAAIANAQKQKGQTPTQPWDINPLNPKNQGARRTPYEKPIHALKRLLPKGRD